MFVLFLVFVTTTASRYFASFSTNCFHFTNTDKDDDPQNENEDFDFQQGQDDLPEQAEEAREQQGQPVEVNEKENGKKNKYNDDDNNNEDDNDEDDSKESDNENQPVAAKEQGIINAVGDEEEIEDADASNPDKNEMDEDQVDEMDAMNPLKDGEKNDEIVEDLGGQEETELSKEDKQDEGQEDDDWDQVGLVGTAVNKTVVDSAVSASGNETEALDFVLGVDESESEIEMNGVSEETEFEFEDAEHSTTDENGPQESQENQADPIDNETDDFYPEGGGSGGEVLVEAFEAVVLIEGVDCVGLKESYIYMTNFMRNEAACMENPNSCSGGCCRLTDGHVECDKENAYPDAPCICNHNTE